jgi:lipid II:glycine glycyltransferase (peptidoglycan interpeptide bridge formation enzyme)
MRIVTQIHEGVWNQFLDRSVNKNIFHTPAMHQVFSSTDRCMPRVWAVVDEDGAIRGILPTVDIAVFDGVMRSWTTRTVVFGSLLSDGGKGAADAVGMLLRTYRREVAKSTLFTELRNIADMESFQPVLQDTGFIFEPHLNYLIDLTRSESELWGSIRSNARRNIRKAQKTGVVIEDVRDESRMGEVYEVIRHVYKRIQVPLPDQSLFESAFRVLHPKGMLRVLMARRGDQDIGALMLLIYRNMLHYWYTGTLEQFFEYRPADLLVWHSLVLGKEMGCTTFDFGGAGRPDEVYRVRDFKAKFGGDLVNYGRNVCVHAPFRLGVSRAGYGLVRKFL